MNQPISDYLFQCFKRDMDVINKIVDEMNLDNKIFKEEY